MSKSFFNNAASGWDEKVEHDARKIKKVISRLPEPEITPLRILDAGSGTGVLVPFLRERYPGAEITELDYAREMIKQAKRKFSGLEKIKFIVGDIYTYPLPEDYFSMIICYSVFPHFLEKKKVLKRFKTLLDKTGILVIFHSESRQAINEMHHNHQGKLPEETWLPSVEKVAGLAGEIGYEIIRTVDNQEQYLLVLKQ